MKILFVDCYAGAAGDMLLAALVNLGLNEKLIFDLPDKLGLKGLKPVFHDVSDHGLKGLKFDLEILEEQGQRHLEHINEIIDSSDLSEQVKNFAKQAFLALAKAEARVHGTTIEKIHFHEVGADDAIIDIVGFFTALEVLGWPKVYSSPPILGKGTTRSSHGVIPLPAPAVVEILKNIPVKLSDFEGETVTPTGASLLATSAVFESCPEMIIEAVGYGAGSRKYEDRPNMLRVMLGQTSEEYEHDIVTIFETNIDDMNPQIYDHLFNRLFKAGALDVFVVPVMMKKNRPGQLLTVLCKKQVAPEVSAIIFSETTTTGIRVRESKRHVLPRRIELVVTPYGEVTVKIVDIGGQEKVIPEYEDCRQLAVLKNVPVSKIIEAAAKSFLGKG